MGDELGNYIILDKMNRDLMADHRKGDVEPIPFSIYATDYYGYTIFCKTLTVADVDAVENWKFADAIRIVYVNQPNADVQKRIGEILVTMPHVEFEKHQPMNEFMWAVMECSESFAFISYARRM